MTSKCSLLSLFFSSSSASQKKCKMQNAKGMKGAGEVKKSFRAFSVFPSYGTVSSTVGYDDGPVQCSHVDV